MYTADPGQNWLPDQQSVKFQSKAEGRRAKGPPDGGVLALVLQLHGRQEGSTGAELPPPVCKLASRIAGGHRYQYEVQSVTQDNIP